MRPIVDAETLIACVACAKAKAKCDKRLPACSRCLLKRLKCEPRQPRRYPEAFQLLQSDAQPQPVMTPGNITSAPSPTSHLASGTRSNQLGFDSPSTFDGIEWPQDSMGSMRSDAEEFSDATTGSMMQQYDSAFSNLTPGLLHSEPSLGFSFAAPPHHNRPRDDHSPMDNTVVPPDASDVMELETTSPSHPSTTTPDIRFAPSLIDEDWPCFSCNPPTQRLINPRTGGEYLMRLEKTLENIPTWDSENLLPQVPNFEVHVNQVEETSRDKLMVIAQGFFSRARDVHHAVLWEANLSRPASRPHANPSGFFILPPTFVLEGFLKIYWLRVEQYLNFFPGKNLDLEDLIVPPEEKVSSLLTLLMIAHGAMGSSNQEAHEFSSGLIETCRICIFDVMEKNVELSAHPTMLQCALLYLHASAWSGNKWHMDLSIAHSRLFASMIGFTRMQAARNSALLGVDVTTNAGTAWRIWRNEERLNRMTYSWVILDSEINLFHDRQPDLDLTDFKAPLPSSKLLWEANSVDAWMTEYLESSENPGSRYGRSPNMSAAVLFDRFMNGSLSEMELTMSWLDLRLILHPLQALIYHLNKTYAPFFQSGRQRQLQRFYAQLEDVQLLLRRWYEFAQRSFGKDIPPTCLVIYHLISLNSLIYFPDVEKLARGEYSIEVFRTSLWAGKRYSEDAAQIWTHSAQILRAYEALPSSSRPHWWHSSIYRVALCMWATGVASEKGKRRSELEHMTVDAPRFGDPSGARFMRNHNGVPIPTNFDSSLLLSDEPLNIVRHCIGLLEVDIPGSRLAGGIKARLELLLSRFSLK